MTHWQEIELPSEWLRRLDEQDGSYAKLVRESGNLALAAHRLARAKRRVLGTGDSVPTLNEVMAAARKIAAQLPDHPDLPTPSVVGADVQGLCIGGHPPR